MDRILILAGGFGTRLRSVVSDVPKPLAPINGKPFLTFLLESWVKQGIENYTFLLHHESDMMIRYIKSLQSSILQNAEVQWMVEPWPLGTGGSIAYAVHHRFIKGDFIVANADTWLGSGIQEVVASEANAIGVVKVENTSRYGQVIVENKLVTSFLEKEASSGSGWINAGLYKLSAPLFEGFAGQVFSLERNIFPQLAKEKQLKAVSLDTEFIDIGIPEDYHRFIEWVKLDGKKSL